MIDFANALRSNGRFEMAESVGAHLPHGWCAVDLLKPQVAERLGAELHGNLQTMHEHGFWGNVLIWVRSGDALYCLEACQSLERGSSRVPIVFINAHHLGNPWTFVEEDPLEHLMGYRRVLRGYGGGNPSRLLRRFMKAAVAVATRVPL